MEGQKPREKRRKAAKILGYQKQMKLGMRLCSGQNIVFLSGERTTTCVLYKAAMGTRMSGTKGCIGKPSSEQHDYMRD